MISLLQRIKGLGIGVLLLVIGVLGCNQRPAQRESRFLMGTIVEVTSSDARAAGIAFDEISRLENILSKYKEYSDVSKLNRDGKLVVGPETIDIIKKAKEFCQATDGAFDITVAPLLDIWGFTNREYRVPSEVEIKNTLKLVGSDKIIIDEKSRIVSFKEKGMKIDLGGIAKGYAVDCAVKALKAAGINSALINIGGDMYCLGDKDANPWKIAVKDPRGKGVVDNLELKDKAVATSGDYEQYFESSGKRYCHIFNPKTGYPVDTKVDSVTVIYDDCTTASVLAKIIFILGKEKGRDVINKFPGVKFKVIEDVCLK